VLHIKQININREVNPGYGFAGLGPRFRRPTISIFLELLADEGEDLVALEAAMTGGTIQIASKEILEKIEEATQGARDAVAELRLEKEYLEKKIDELQGLTKRLLEDR
jgi:acyl-CoA reductase-like NAD-dependent aldehyde dehydrogenase